LKLFHQICKNKRRWAQCHTINRAT